MVITQRETGTLLAAAASIALLILAPMGARAQTDRAVFFEGPVRIARGDTVESLVVLEGPTRVDGIVRDDLVALGGDVTVTGTVGGDLVALGGVVRLEPRAQVGGDVVTARSPHVATGAQVGGALRSTEPTADSAGGVFGYLLGWLGMTVSAFLIALLLGWLVPRRAADALYETARAQPAKSLGVGLLVAIALPVIAIAAMITVVGIPFGIAILLGLVALAFAGFVAAGWVLGRVVAERWPRAGRWPALGWLALGVAILCALTLVPVLGTLVWIAASFLGIGAGTLAAYDARARTRPRARAPEPPPPPRAYGTEHPAGA